MELTSIGNAGSDETVELIGEDLTVRHSDWGDIFVRNKRRADLTDYTCERTVILQHGATYGSTAFDMRFGGLSWMDYLALRGFDTYCLDLPGYGRSERPSQMREAPENNAPFMRTPDAASCLGRVIDEVRHRRQLERVCLIGWSWGTAITSFFTAAHEALVERLVLYAPVWDRTSSGPSPIHVSGDIGAYRTVDREATLARRRAGLLATQHDEVMPLSWFDQWWEASMAMDAAARPGTIRAPNGVVQDGVEYWNAGVPLYEPQKVTAPVLLVVGEWDNDTPPHMAQTLFPLFSSAAWKRLTILSGGTHAMLMERNRMLLFRTVQQFLEESAPGVAATS
ncbi:MAG: alpha/beta hydrolase [Gammaproteobacteria bacterium]|nr:alpha/beta hydrolase [Gammaproteobacteria bacterium]